MIIYKHLNKIQELKRNIIYSIERAYRDFFDSFSLYKKPNIISWRRKFGIELHFGKRNIIGFCLFELTSQNFRQPLTPIYVYPFNNIKGILIEEIKARRFFMTNEVIRIVFLVDELIEFLKNEYESSYKNRKNLKQKDLQKQIAKKVKQRFKSVKIVGLHV
jgi:hypothetical protein